MRLSQHGDGQRRRFKSDAMAKKESEERSSRGPQRCRILFEVDCWLCIGDSAFATSFSQCSPYWDPLRGDPRFEIIVNDLAPKSAAE
jgi:hypothetical protein